MDEFVRQRLAEGDLAPVLHCRPVAFAAPPTPEAEAEAEAEAMEVDELSDPESSDDEPDDDQ